MDAPKTSVSIPVFLSPVSAGFPSPANDYLEKSLDLNEYLIRKPASTFIARAKGDSMQGAGIDTGDLLIIDRSLTPAHRSVVVAMLNGEFTVKRILYRDGATFLHPENPKYRATRITEEHDFEIWGVVVHVIKSFR